MQSEPPSKRIKIKYKDFKYSLGRCPKTIEDLYDLIKATLNILGNISLYYKDNENDKITITTTYSYLEALNQNNVLELEVLVNSSSYQTVVCKDSEFEIRKCVERLKAVFSVVIGGRVVGSGVVTNTKLALTCSKVLPSPEVAKTAFAIFDSSGFQFDFNPEEVWVSIEDLTLITFLAPFSLVDIAPIEINGSLVPRDNDVIYTLHQPQFQDLKYSIKKLALKEVLGNRLYFDSSTQCGPAGSPIFDNEWRLIGIQTTECQLKNLAIRCSEIYNILTQIHLSPLLAQFIEQIKPIKPPQEIEIYQKCLQSNCNLNYVYGISQSKDQLMALDPQNSQTKFFNLEEKQSEGYSLCSLDFGLCISGGKSSPRKAWICFLFDFPKYFKLEIPEAFYTHGSIFLHPKVVLIGGRNESNVQRDCYSVDIYTREWTRFYSLQECRSYPAVCKVNTQVYVFGGFFRSDLASIEKLELNGWSICDVTMPLSLFGCCVLNIDTNKVLICGGMYNNIKPSDKIYRLDLSKKTYSEFYANQKLGILSSSSILSWDNSLLVYNQIGELIHYDKTTGAIKKYPKPLIIN